MRDSTGGRRGFAERRREPEGHRVGALAAGCVRLGSGAQSSVGAALRVHAAAKHTCAAPPPLSQSVESVSQSVTPPR
eukprot:7056681-Pyramimonas_sp.AAC.1